MELASSPCLLPKLELLSYGLINWSLSPYVHMSGHPSVCQNSKDVWTHFLEGGCKVVIRTVAKLPPQRVILSLLFINWPIMDRFPNLRCLWKHLDKIHPSIMLKFLKSKYFIQRRLFKVFENHFPNFRYDFRLSRGKI